ncbi:MAG: leucine-rich repeat protein [Oscillospiraceae bacterium]|nr:leucine-rich repeat protein [Oscillospiraceae bacterium]
MNHMKLFRKIAGLLALVSSVSAVPAFPASAAYTYENLQYESGVAGEIHIVGCDEDVTDLVIPETINGKPVTKIMYGVFRGNENLESVTIPETMQVIAQCAFQDCKNLKEINMPETYVDIAGNAFSGTRWYLLTYNQPVTYLGNMVYKTNLGENQEEVTIREGTLSIAGGAFRGDKNLKKINLPDSLQIIGDGAFSYSELTSIEIPENVMFIGEDAFRGTKPETLTVAENNANYTSMGNILYNKNLTKFIFVPQSVTEVTVPDTITEIPDDAFYYCDNLTNVTLPETLISIGKDAFCRCENLTNITLPENLISIGEHAFENSGITEITIPASVKTIKNGAFGYCKNLESIRFAEGTEVISSDLVETELLACGDICWSEIFYEYWGAFLHSYALKKIYLPSTLRTIEENAFGSCENYLNQFDIFYYGTRDDWQNVMISEQDNAQLESGGNESILKANMHYMPASDKIIAGDVDLDEKTTILDVVILQKYLLNQYRLTEQEFARADVNQDSVVNIYDLCILKKNLVS